MEKTLTFLGDLVVARRKPDFPGRVEYEMVIEDLLEMLGLSEKQVDLIWEITEPELE